ncbi:MAG: hypothetical protein IAE94_16280 [Chthoniobacterales bacterium]|nr:hypothetical protein [Chthoniobacterales bacterium]
MPAKSHRDCGKLRVMLQGRTRWRLRLLSLRGDRAGEKRLPLSLRLFHGESGQDGINEE